MVGWAKKVWLFYRDGFRNQTWGRPLIWLVVLKFFILFAMKTGLNLKGVIAVPILLYATVITTMLCKATVLGVTAVADTLPDAVKDAYALAGEITFENRYCRSDIGARALKALK